MPILRPVILSEVGASLLDSQERVMGFMSHMPTDCNQASHGTDPITGCIQSFQLAGKILKQ